MTKRIIVIGIVGLAVFFGSAAVGISTRIAPPDSILGQASTEDLAQSPPLENLFPEEPVPSEEPSSAEAQTTVKETEEAKSISPEKNKEDGPKEKPAEAQKSSEAIKKEDQKALPAEPEAQSSEADQAQWQGKLKITGSASFSSSVRKALDLLAEKVPAYAKKVDIYLTEIRESDHSGVEVQTGVFHLGKYTVSGQDAFWLASVIVHDAYHAELYQKGQDYTGKAAEARCIEEQKNALLAMGAPDSYQTHLNQILESNYWDVPFENRNW